MVNWSWSSFSLSFWYIMPDAKCVLLTTTTLYIVLAKDARFQSIQNLQTAPKEGDDLSDYIVAIVTFWNVVCVFQVCISVFQRSLCDFSLYQQSITYWWKEIWSSSICFSIYISSTEMLHVRLYIFVFCFERMFNVVEIMLCLYKEV